VTQDESAVDSLPATSMRLFIRFGGKEYSCTGISPTEDEAAFPVRLIESGRWVQRCDLQRLSFSDERGAALEIEARLEVVAWPDRLSLILEATSPAPLQAASAGIALSTQGHSRTTVSPVRDLDAGGTVRVALTWQPEAEDEPNIDPRDVVVTDIQAVAAPVPISYDAERAWVYVDLPERQWDVAAEPDRLDRYTVQLTNASPIPKRFPLLFAFDGPFPGITGLCPVLRDERGAPTGIPVQISKNWHRMEGRPLLYEGPWFHGFVQVAVEPGETWSGELAIAYARWGGVPSASHAQLCLVGWGVNQRWDQAAIGSWGESICYDPDICLNRSMIDDVRPLLVTGMNGGQWEWTCNVGGGDFLVYIDSQGQRQFLTDMRTAYLAGGPNLTETHYAGITADGRVAAHIRVATPRCDDINRAYHHLRYDVLSPTPFSRMAFYQVGADRYNDHQFTTIARGNAEVGLVEEWRTRRGGERHLRTGIACEGKAPWFSLHGGIRNRHHPEGAWANRGLVIRSWRARLGGKDVPSPAAGVYGTVNGIPGANIELLPPDGITQLERGDYVEADLELLVIPAGKNDYYGPNTAFGAHLAQHADSWEPVYRQAKGNHLEVNVLQGQLLRSYPPVVAVAPESGTAEFTLDGGLGYVPVTITGLPAACCGTLECNGRAVDQSVHGNDFWQTDRNTAGEGYSITFNVNLDTERNVPETHSFVFRLLPNTAPLQDSP
jgi:hypothetical protein